MSLVFVYAILDTPPKSAPEGVAGARLRFIGANGATIAVSDHATAPKPEEPTLRAHDTAVRALCEHSDAVLPARFGQTFASDRALLDAIADRRTEIDEALTLVRGCVQMTLRISATATETAAATATATATATETATATATATETATATATETATATATDPTPGTAYLQSRARAVSLPELTPLRTALKDLIRAERQAEASSPALPWRTSVFHLIPRTRIKDYSAILSRVAPTLPIPLKASGPWPPYAFADSLLR